MKRIYVLVFSDGVGTREEIKNLLDKSPLVHTWRYEMPNSFFLVSSEYCENLCRSLFGSEKNRPRYFMTEIGTNYWGSLTADAWYMIDKKVAKPESSPALPPPKPVPTPTKS